MPESENNFHAEPYRPKLLEGETDLKVEDIPSYTPEYPPSSLRELERLAQVKAGGEVGQFGPAVASLALERHGQESASDELRKYEVFFVRDGLRVAFDVFPIYPLLLHATIHATAELQGISDHAAREEEPGRSAHEDRNPDDPIAQELTTKYGWEWPYYGAVDTTPQFVRAIALYVKETPGGESLLRETYTGRDSERHTIAHGMENALNWIEHRMDSNPEGLIEYKSSIPHGIENQVWRDSWDAYFHEDGTLANRDRGIASVEVQQLTYDALLDAATVYERHLNDTERADELRIRAAKIKQNIFDYFWIDEKGGYFAVGTDRDDSGTVRPLKIRTSDMGHLLNSRLLAGEPYRQYREALIWQLFSSEMLNVSGIRTLASDEVRFRPGAYHNGSVWLWDTYYIAEGLRKHGYYGLASVLANKIHTVINVTQKFPEYVRGDDKPSPSLNTQIVTVWDENHGRVNKVEQPPQEVQAWSVAAEVRRDYFSGLVPDRAYDARAVIVEDAVLAMLEANDLL